MPGGSMTGLGKRYCPRCKRSVWFSTLRMSMSADGGGVSQTRYVCHRRGHSFYFRPSTSSKNAPPY